MDNAIIATTLSADVTAKPYYATGDGVTDDYNAVNTAVTALNAAGGGRLLLRGTVRIASSLTIPSTVSVSYAHGAKWSIDSGQTLTINGLMPDAPYSQIFSGSGTVAFGTGVKTLYSEWWGAAGDGTTNDRTALNAALTAASGNGAVVQLLARTYRCAAVGLFSNSVLRGAGMGSTILKQVNSFSGSGATPMVLRSSNQAVAINNVLVEDLTIDGNKASQSGGTGDGNAQGIRIDGWTNFTIRNCLIQNCWTDGIYITGLSGGATQGYSGLIEGCVIAASRRNNVSVVCGKEISFVGCTLKSASGIAPQAGIDIEPNSGQTAEGIILEACHIFSNAGNGVAFHNNSGTNQYHTVRGCYITANAGGVTLADCTNIHVQGNNIVSNSGIGVNLDSGSVAVVGCIVKGNTIKGHSNHGVYSEGNGGVLSERNQIAGNHISSNGVDGINLVSTATRFIVEGNVIYLNGGDGIDVNGSVDHHILGNYIYQNDEHGINLRSGAHRNTVMGNRIESNSQDTTATYDGVTLFSNCDNNFIHGNFIRQGTGAKVQRYGVNVQSSTCDTNFITNNDLRTSGTTGSLHDLGTGTITAAGNQT